MKNWLFTITFLIISANVFSQVNTANHNYEAGLELRKASKYYYLGLASEIAGASLIYIGANHFKPSPDHDADKARKYEWARTDCYIFGGILLFTGVATNLSAFYHVGLAGKKLTMKPTGDGLTLSLNL